MNNDNTLKRIAIGVLVVLIAKYVVLFLLAGSY